MRLRLAGPNPPIKGGPVAGASVVCCSPKLWNSGPARKKQKSGTSKSSLVLTEPEETPILINRTHAEDDSQDPCRPGAAAETTFHQGLPGLRRPPGPLRRLRGLSPVRMVPVRLSTRAEQLGLGLASPPAPILDQRRRGTTFRGLRITRLLNPPDATGMPFWSLNPYVGCEFGCCYCYARDTHRWTAERQGLAPAAAPAAEFERLIFVKRYAALTLRKTLDTARIGRATLLIGTATDPYQPAERRFEITRSVLAALMEYRGLTIRITTKSPLVTRDIDLLRALAGRHDLAINISLITLDPELIRQLEPKTPLPHARLRGLRLLTDAGLRAGLLIAPVVPGLTDGWGALGGLMAAGKDAGACFADGFALRLGAVARAGFLPAVQRQFPALSARYRRHYRGRRSASPDYLAALARRIRTLQRIHGLPVTGRMPTSRVATVPPASAPAGRPLSPTLFAGLHSGSD